MNIPVSPTVQPKHGIALAVLYSISGSHLLNDLMQFLLPALYPLLKETYGLSYLQIGLLTLAQQITACLLQPAFGLYGDVKPKPFWLPLSLGIVGIGVVMLATANSFGLLFMAAMVMGTGSALFHPEASRLSRLASGGRLGFAQSLFQVGGNLGTALGPIAAAMLLIPLGQLTTAWFGLAALLGVLVLARVARWYGARQRKLATQAPPLLARSRLGRQGLVVAFAVIAALLLSKYVYIETLKSYYSFYLIDKFDLSAQQAQYFLFMFLGAIAAGTLIGGPVGDRFGRLAVIWGSIVGALPFTLLLPHMDLAGTAIVSVLIGLILSSAFSAIVVYAQELVPGKVGMVAGFVFGFAFGIGALGAAILGGLADQIGIEAVFKLCAFLPVLGVLAYFLPGSKTVQPDRDPLDQNAA